MFYIECLAQKNLKRIISTALTFTAAGPQVRITKTPLIPFPEIS